MNTYDIARNWIARGYSVIPVTYRSKRPAFDALRITGCVVDGEISWSMFKERQATEYELKAWFTGPKRNIGIVTGFKGLVVLDFDTLDFYTAWQAWAASVGGKANEVTESYTVCSARGVHVYVTCEEQVESFAVSGIDVKARWGYVLAPPSVHPSGREYAGVGESIVGCKRLEDVFPFSKPEFIANTLESEPESDPWKVADNAVNCGGSGAIERIKARISVSELLGVTLNGHKTALVNCPLHDDRHPSMIVYADGHCMCLAGCAGGRQLDILDLYAAIHNITNREAIAILGSI